MSSPIDLELNVRPLDETSYALELRYDDPQSNVELIANGRVDAALLDPDNFRAHLTEPNRYGQQLSAAVWSDAAIQAAFAKAYALATEQKVALRFRLYISPDLGRPHSLRWETLQHPEVGVISANEDHTVLALFAGVELPAGLPSSPHRPESTRLRRQPGQNWNKIMAWPRSTLRWSCSTPAGAWNQPPSRSWPNLVKVISTS